MTDFIPVSTEKKREGCQNIYFPEIQGTTSFPLNTEGTTELGTTTEFSLTGVCNDDITATPNYDYTTPDSTATPESGMYCSYSARAS